MGTEDNREYKENESEIYSENVNIQRFRELLLNTNANFRDFKETMEMWLGMDENSQEHFQNDIVQYLVNLKSVSNLGFYWSMMDASLQKTLFNPVLDAINVGKSEQKNERILEIWANTEKDIQQENKDVFWQGFNYYEENKKLPLEFYKLWRGTKNQEEYFEEIYRNHLQNDVFLGFTVEELWKWTSEELQRKELSRVLNENPERVQQIFNATDANIQSEYFDSLLSENSNEEKIISLYAGMNDSLKEKHIDLFWKIIEQNFESDRETTLNLWKSMSDEFKDNNIMKMFDIAKDDLEYMVQIWKEDKFYGGEKYRANTRYLFNRIKNDPKLVKETISKINFYSEENKNIFREIVDVFGDDVEQQINCWKNISSITQEDNISWLDDFCEKNRDKPDAIVEIFLGSIDDIKKEKFQLLESVVKDGDISENLYTRILNNLPNEMLTKEFVSELIEGFGKEESKIILETYTELSRMSPQLNKTLNLGILKQEIAEDFNLEELVKLSTDSNIQEKLVKNYSNTNFKKAIEYVMANSKDWVLDINAVCSNIDEHNELMKNIENKSLDANEIKQLYYCLSEKKNWFQVNTQEELSNYTERKRKICTAILEGKDVTGLLSKDFEALNENEKKIFAFLELTYGMDIETAQNIVYKYGEDIKDINGEAYGQTHVVEEIKNLKAILQLSTDGIDELYAQGKNDIQNWKDIEYSAGTQIESNALALYRDIYNEQMKTEEQQMGKVEYDGKSVSVSEITGDFKFLIRVEGAYSFWKEPDDFSAYFDEVNPNSNGNCKSLVGNNILARARPKGPTFGYDNCDKTSILMSAPWDIVSREANHYFSPSSVSWDFNNGIQFRLPNKVLDATRDNHNETVTQKWYWNKETQTLERDKPNFVLYMKPTSDTDISQDSQYAMSVKAAAQLGIPLKIIDVEKNMAREQEKILNNLSQFCKMLDREDVSIEDAEKQMKKIIVDFENNKVAMRFVDEKVSQNYFTSQVNEHLYSTITSKIKDYEKVDEKGYKQLSQCFEDIMTDEQEKLYTNTGRFTSGITDRGRLLRCKGIMLDTADITKFGFDEKVILPEFKETMKKIEKLDYYDGNKAHSIEHIEKVTLFSGMLAELNGFSNNDRKTLLAAAAFHDSGRMGRDGGERHAEASAEQVMQYFKENPKNPFGINYGNIGIIQTAIHYHEFPEKEIGHIDEKEIETLAKQYGVKDEDLESTKKICEALKDADALDRFRFANRARLDKRFLRSKSAHLDGVINFANNVNRALAERTLTELYGIDPDKIIAGEEVSMLRQERLKKSRENREYVEGHLGVDTLFDIIGLGKETKEHDVKKDKLMQLYRDYEITEEDIKSVTRMFAERTQPLDRRDRNAER